MITGGWWVGNHCQKGQADYRAAIVEPLTLFPVKHLNCGLSDLQAGSYQFCCAETSVYLTRSHLRSSICHLVVVSNQVSRLYHRCPLNLYESVKEYQMIQMKI